MNQIIINWNFDRKISIFSVLITREKRDPWKNVQMITRKKIQFYNFLKIIRSGKYENSFHILHYLKNTLSSELTNEKKR